MSNAERTGVVLLQLGGPQSLDDVRPFLYNFFVDLIPDNIPVPRFFVKPLAWIIAALRADHSRQLYAAIGGRSPLRDETELQARALRSELARRDRAMPVYVAMRNWRPSTQDALRAAKADGVTRLIGLPLYPQYSYATTRSSLNELKRVIANGRFRPELRTIEEYCEDRNYATALVDLIRRHLAGFSTPPDRVHLIFSAHGLPVKYVERGDPYAEQVRRTMNAVISRLNHPGPSHLSFQSRLGPAKWLEPSSEELIRKLAREGVKAICMIPIAFVCEHVETLNEMDIGYARLARDCGVAEFARVCAVKSHPSFIACLADQVGAALSATGASS